jgi:hypothetical protein
MISSAVQRTEGAPSGASTMCRAPASISSPVSSRAPAGPGKRAFSRGSRAVKKTWAERVISAGSRPMAAQCWSPPAPIMIGGPGRCTGLGSQTAPASSALPSWPIAAVADRL